MISTRNDQVLIPEHPASIHKMDPETGKAAVTHVHEEGTVHNEPKAYYSKQSVWLMILYSGLAIGSDG